MTTNRIKILSFIMLIAFVGVFFSACEKEDNTNKGTLNPEQVTISVTPAFTSPVTMVEMDSTFEYTVTLDKPQLVDIKLLISQTAGAVESPRFSYLNSITIYAGSTSAKGWIKVTAVDEVLEDESFTVQVGNNEVANAIFTPVSFVFNINTYKSGALASALSWESDVATSVGIDDAAEDVANLSLMVLNKSDLSPVVELTADGYKTYDRWDTLADGTYLIAAEFVSNKDYGDAHTTITYDLGVDFSQAGVQFESMEFDAIVDDEFACASVYLAEVTKAGSSYTLTKVGEKVIPFDASVLDGKHPGADYGSGVYEDFTIENGTLDSLDVYGFFTDVFNAWGTRTDSVFVRLYIDDKGNIDFTQQYYCSNAEGDPNGDWVYYIEVYDNSFWNPCTNELYLYYDIIWINPADGSYGWMFDEGLLALIDLSTLKSARAFNSLVPNNIDFKNTKGVNGRFTTGNHFVK